MTKDEFLSMISSELDNLEQEYRNINQRVEYFRALNPSSREVQVAEYQQRRTQQKIIILMRLVELPAYARIQAMSDIEIEEYKKEKTSELELKIREIEAREEQERAKLSQLKAEQERLISQFGILTGSARDTAIYRGQQLAIEISRYETDDKYGILAALKSEIEEVKKEQEQIQVKTAEEIKTELCSKIQGNSSLAQAIDSSKNPLDATTELQAAVADDPEKAQQMANLLSYYRNLSSRQMQVKGYMYLPYGLPKALVLDLDSRSYNYDSSTNQVGNPDKLMEIVEGYEGIFEKTKATYMEQFTEEKLSKLVGKQYDFNSTEVDMPFLEQHADKLGAGELNHLQGMVEERNRLSKKIIKTKAVKDEITYLNVQISKQQPKMYHEIIGWYESSCRGILGINRAPDFYSMEALTTSLERSMEDIKKSEAAISEVKNQIQKVKAAMEQSKQNYEDQKAEVARQIRDLGGKEHEKTDIPYAAEQTNYNLEVIGHAGNRVYEEEIINRVQQEAQNQANAREAELREMVDDSLQPSQPVVTNEATVAPIQTAELGEMVNESLQPSQPVVTNEAIVSPIQTAELREMVNESLQPSQPVATNEATLTSTQGTQYSIKM